MNSVKNLLAAVGLFPQDDSVLARAAEIARAHHAKLTVVHVIDGLTAGDLASMKLVQIKQHMALLTRERVENAVASLAVDGIDIDIRIETGSPPLRVSDVAKEISADLIVMRAHQNSSIVEKIVGSTTDRVIRISCAPVLVVKRPVEQPYQRIVVAIDPADKSRKVVPVVAALFPGAALSLVHSVYISPQFEEAMRRSGTGTAGLAAHRDFLIFQAKSCLRDAAKGLEPRSLRATIRVVVGTPAEALIRATWSSKVDLIVLGPGSTGRLRQALLGSVTRHVLRKASCDVLVFRTGQQ